MRLSSKLSTTLPAILGLVLLSSCSQPAVTSNGTSNGTSAVTESASPAAEDSAALVSNDTDATEAKAVEAVPPSVFAEDGIAIRGADPVAYFTEGQYVAGTADYTYEWADATWQFSSAENRDLFASNPTQYAPQYGGFCAWAVSEGYTASVDPDAWKVVEGKLYLNYDARIQQRWQQDVPGNIARADQNWPGVLN
ncbi:MAG: YHS domain-containing (seleno)protein [Cyanobacteria bacterium J06621_3]